MITLIGNHLWLVVLVFCPDLILFFLFGSMFFCEKLEESGGSQVMFETGAVKPLGKKSVQQFMKQSSL